MAQRELVDTPKAAEHLGDLSPHTLENWRHLGTGPRFFRVGGRIKYDVKDLDAWLEARATEAA